VERGLREIIAVDRRFDPMPFSKARAAYRIVLEAFWRGDKDELWPVRCRGRASFIEAIDDRWPPAKLSTACPSERGDVVGASYNAPLRG
jgi:hypothetical protein